MMRQKKQRQNPKKSRVSYRIGDIIAIPRVDGHHSYGRIYRDLGLAVYRCVTKGLADPYEVPGHGIAFYCYFFDTAVKSGAWPIIGHLGFASEEESWPPPMWHLDEISGEYEIRYKDTSRSASKREIKGLYEDVMWYPEGLVAELCKRLPSADV
jgi:hypothetical protein